MASNWRDSVSSASPTSPQVERGRFQGAWNAFRARFSTNTVDTPATQTLDGIYVEVFDDMETAEVNSKMVGDKERVKQKPVTNLEKKIYDLNFLLELGKKETKAPHPLRFSSDAIKQNILKGSNLGKHKDPRARGLSNVSKDSMGSDAEELLFKRTEPREQIEPCRQPVHPPDTPLAQIHAGFRRFLKEHSSPPHSRVTAGGRIVPVGPHGSALPSLNPSSIADVIHGQAPAQAISIPQVASTTGNVKGHGRGGSSPTMENIPIASTRRESQGNSQLPKASVVTAQANTGLANVYVPGFPTPLPFGAQVLMKLAHGPTLVTSNGVLFEAISDGPNTILAQLHGFQQGTQLSPAPMLPSFPMAALMPTASMQPLPLINMTNNMPVAFNQAAVEAERQALQKQLDDLRTQLDQLDKHVALNRPQIGSIALSAAVAQRRQLVVQIDETRVAKENLDKPTQIDSRSFNAQALQAPQGVGIASTANYGQGQHFPAIGLPALAGGPHMYGPGYPVHAGIPVQNVAAQLSSSHGFDSDSWKAQETPHNTVAQSWQQLSSGTTNPTFPNNHSTTQANPHGLEYGKHGWKAKGYNRQNFPGNDQGTGYVPTTFDDQSSVIWSDSHGTFQQPFDANVQGHNVTYNGYTSNQPSYGLARGEAVRIPFVTEEMASYATRLGLNPPNKPKKYCSTPEEFMEVMRQAREQARLYGRVGCSPCGPEDDAEEDVRWALLDDRPILLPKAVPDYISNPQPWNFESQYEEFINNTGSSWEKVQWGIHNSSVHGYPINRENPAQAHPYAHAQAELSHANQYRAGYGQETTIPVSGPVNHQTTWTENGNGQLIHQPKHAYVEDVPETPARYGFNNGSLTGGSVTSPAYPVMPNMWNLPTLEECDTEGESKGSKAESIDSWATQPQFQPDYIRNIFKFEIDGKEVTEQEKRDDMLAKELAEKSAMTSSSGQKNQKDLLQAMLRDPRHSSTDSQTKSHEERVEELRRRGFNAAGFSIHYSPASSIVNDENQRSGSYSSTHKIQNVMAREGERIGGMQHFGGFGSGAQQSQNAMARGGERIGEMQPFGGYKDSRMYKAGPSVGVPLYQARGHVPQYDGAMDSLSSEVTATTETSSEASSEASSRRSSRQVTRVGTQAGAKAAMNAMAQSFVYDSMRRFPTTEAVHYEAVDRFFNTIREEERAEIAKYRALNYLM